MRDDVALERSGDVAVPALDHIETARVHCSSIHRCASRAARSGSDGGVDGADRRRAEIEPVGQRLQGRAVELVHEHDDLVRRRARQAHHRSALVVALQGVYAFGVVADERHADMAVGQERAVQPRACAPVGNRSRNVRS